jgi:TolB-like protein/DNA-binding winged helix-turn-helix (wHTH) protein
MERPNSSPIRIGAWVVRPASSEMTRNGEVVRLELRTLRLLMCLADRAGEVVSIDDLLGHVWSGVVVSPDSVYQAVALLRRLLGDDSKQPTYIETVPRLGYRMVAAVGPLENGPAVPMTGSAAEAAGEPRVAIATTAVSSRGGFRFSWAVGALVCALMVAAFAIVGRLSNHKQSAAVMSDAQKSIAVLPFLDLTDDRMSHETFADGMTEELIDRLSKVPGLRVPAPTASFYFKGKKKAVADIAAALGVTYVLDGSVRLSGSTLRVAARLVRADTGYVVWSDSYDRPFDDVLTVQDNIAGEVTKALVASIDSAADTHKSE